MISGITGSIAGIGGGIIIVPALMFIFLVPSQQAAGTSLVIIVIIAFSAVIAYAKQRRIDYRSGILFIIASAPGALLGAYIGHGFTEEAFSLFFGMLMILLLLFLSIDPQRPKNYGRPSVKRKFHDAMGKSHEYGFNRTIALLVAFCVGIISSLFGIGGGILMVPAMIMLFSFPVHIATATSMFIILISSMVGSLAHAFYNHILWQYVLLLAPGAYLGGIIGAQLAMKVRSKNLIVFLKILVFILAVKILVF